MNNPPTVRTEAGFLPVDESLERAVAAKGQELFALMAKHPAPGIFSTKGVYARLMEWSLRDPDFKARLFRFVDVLPSLDSSAEVVRHLREYLGEDAAELNPALRVGLGAASLAPGLVAGPIKSQVVAMARQFVAGETPGDLIDRFLKNTGDGIATTVDLLGETVVSESEADQFLERNLSIFAAFDEAVRKHPKPGASDLGPNATPLPRLNLSVKISALSPDVQAADPAGSIEALKGRLRPILRRAAKSGAFVNFDMESTRLKDLTLALFRSILEEEEFHHAPAVGIALQAYLRECERDLRELIAWARTRNRRIGVRLVKGAYWDSETILAGQRGWPQPVWSRKSETDANYELLTLRLLENTDVVSPAFASHNVRSCAHAIARAQVLGVDPLAFEFQALYGMADDLKHALRQLGYRVREYCAVGDLLPGMAYLVRRLLENTSNEGFLRQSQLGESSREQLLRNPVAVLRGEPPAAPRIARAFSNMPAADFTREDARRRFSEALAEVSRNLGREWPLVIGGRRQRASATLPSVNPARPSQVIGLAARGTIADADAAVAAARAAQPAWGRLPAAERAAVIERAGSLIRERRFELAALATLEAGKPWAEADGDVCEAADFCGFYAAEMRRLGAPRITQPVPGERCDQTWVPRGVGTVIAPWNFPIAILCGLTVAPLVAGNAVIVKPSQQTPIIAAVFVDLLIEAGVPPGVVNLVSGLGRDVGARLCEHPEVDFIAFTGSRSVGCALWEVSGRTAPGQANLKKMVCEMGGKNALIVDTDADLDEAIPAALASAFGYSGQKCSALSRLILLDGVHDRFMERFNAACASLPVGDPAHPSTFVGPVIDEAARAKILGYIEHGRRQSTLAFQSTLPAELAASGGYYVPPTVFTGVRPDHVIAREEIFGPVLAVLRARTLDEAFAFANDTDYALTGGVFSRSPSTLERARAEFQVGNLYLNRGITGAVVERHPFGGYKMSGGGTKAGGTGYLENFLFPKATAENVMRRGFAPPED